MADLADIDHLYGNDVGVSPTGDLAMVTNNTRTQQRVIRRLITTPTVIGNSAYPWEPPYGCGLAAKIGAVNWSDDGIQADVLSQLGQEQSILPTPQPTVDVTPFANGSGAEIDIFAWDATGEPLDFSFNVE